MVTSVDNDQRSPAPDAEAVPLPEQPAGSVVETLPDPAAVPGPSGEPAVETVDAAATAPSPETSEAGATPTAPPVDPAPLADPGPVADCAAPVDPVDDPAVASVALAARLSAAEERATAAEATVAALTERLAALESRSEQADGAVRSLEDSVAAADGRLESLTARVAELTDVTARDRTGTAGIGTEVAELRETVRRIDQDTSIAIAREVERHTTAGLLDDRQRLHQASVAMAGLAQSLADAARQVTPELTADSASTLLDSFVVDVDLLLQQLGHEALGVVAGEGFDAKRHRALRRVPTTDPVADRTVARVLRDGYRTPATNRVLLFADVEVFRVTTAAPAGQSPTVTAGTSSEKGS